MYSIECCLTNQLVYSQREFQRCSTFFVSQFVTHVWIDELTFLMWSWGNKNCFLVLCFFVRKDAVPQGATSHNSLRLPDLVESDICPGYGELQ